mgnify:CR=1 FL=1
MKLELSERNLRPELVSQANITRLKILNEGGNEQTPFGEKFTLRVLANDSQKTKFKLQLNVTNKNYLDRKSTRLNSSHSQQSRMPSSA